MVQVPAGRVTETKTTYKTTGTADLPNTKAPDESAAFDNTDAPFKHDAQDVTGYVGVNSEYRTYADDRNKPFPTNAQPPEFLAAQTASAPEGTSEGGEEVEPYGEWNKDDLVAEAGARNLSTSGTKAELAQRLEENDQSAPPALPS